MGNEFRRRPKSGFEQDVHSKYWRRCCCHYKRAGAAAKDKRFTRRRERRELERSVGHDD